MNKAQLLADLEAKVIKIIEGPGPHKAENNGVREYVVTVLEQQGMDKANSRSIAFTVVDEGTAGEVAFYRDTISLPKNDNEAGISYLAGLVQAGTIDRFEVEKSRPDLGPFSFFTALVWADDGTGKLIEKRIMVTRSGTTVSHKDIIG